ncbi:hypothetical protein QBC35DRAFT_535784 [Podospora australis]|uniref:Uncharacterized protein n=1 Tax=Podospora australis TaxID=1536484 RepID=A0AAN6WN80_9PEZI|nr:hypothetical protein QBC35DRAFT_535784 [Podospora australis]
MESPPDSPTVELDTSASSLILPLALQDETPFSPTPTPVRREIFVRRQTWSDRAKVLVIVEKTVDPNGAIVESRRYLDLLLDFVLPVYALPRLNRTKWNVEVGYGQGTARVDYPFRSREGAFQFQQLLTGYKPVEVFEEVTCVVTYWKKFRIPLPQYAGTGQIQLWVEVEQEPGEQTSHSLSPTTTTSRRSSHSSQSTAKRPLSIASIQTTSTLVQRHAERSVMVIQDPRPPLIAAFLKDRDREDGYTMLQMKATDLQITEATTHREEALLSIASAQSRHFLVNKHLPVPGPVSLSAWNICDQRRQPGPDSARIKPLECSHLALNLGSYRDPLNLSKRQNLHDSILRLQLGHFERLQRLNAMRNQQVSQNTREMAQLRTPPSSARTSIMSTRSLPPVLMRSPRASGAGGTSRPALLPEIQTQPWMSTTFITRADGNPQGGRSPELDGRGVRPELETLPTRIS